MERALMQSSLLGPYDSMRRQLTAASQLEDVKHIVDKTEALLQYARRIKDTEAEAELALLKLRAMFQVGRLSKGLEKAVPLAGRGAGLPSSGKTKAAALKTAGISTSAAQRCEVLHSIGEERFEGYLDERRANGTPVTFIQVYSAIAKGTLRAERERALSGRLMALPDKRYAVALLDPPWRFEVRSRESGMDRAAENHYPTMTLDAIKELEIPAAEDALLGLWTTVPFAHIAHACLDLWGFDYVSQMVWVKTRVAKGYWFRNRHEILLIATRGSIPAPAPGDQFESVIEAPQGKHSAKPERVYEIIESYFPTLPKLEMFARGEPRPGWDRWGLEA